MLRRLPLFVVAQMHGRALARATSLLALGDIVAKALAFVFFVVLARATTPSDYGLIRYAVTLGNFGSVLAAAFALTLAQYLASRVRIAETRKIPAVMSLSLVGSIAGMFVALVAGGNGTLVMIGTALVILGLSFSYTYQGINKGSQEFAKAAAYPVVSNILQLVPVLISAIWFPLYIVPIAIASYGLSYFVTLLPFEFFKPAQVRLPLRGWGRAELGGAMRFAAPLIVSHGAYQALFGMDLIWLSVFRSNEIVGFYAAVKTLATVYTVIPNALYGVLMPKTAAEGTSPGARRNLRLALVLALLTNCALLVFFVLAGPLLLKQLFGAGYESAAPALFIIGVGMLFYSLSSVLSAHATGLGASNVQGTAMILGLIASVVVGPVLTIQYGMVGASLSFALGTFIALVVLSVWSGKNAKSKPAS